jgi:hypothetical protein
MMEKTIEQVIERRLQAKARAAFEKDYTALLQFLEQNKLARTLMIKCMTIRTKAVESGVLELPIKDITMIDFFSYTVVETAMFDAVKETYLNKEADDFMDALEKDIALVESHLPD